MVSVPVVHTCPKGAPLLVTSQVGKVVSNFEIGVSELCHNTLDSFGDHPIFPANIFLSTIVGVECLTAALAILSKYCPLNPIKVF